jgi:hypothetical protein
MTFFSLRDVGKKRVVLRLMNGIPAYVWYFVSKFPCESVCFAEKRFMCCLKISPIQWCCLFAVIKQQVCIHANTEKWLVAQCV